MDIAGKQDKIYFFCSRLLAYYIFMQYITLQTKYITIQRKEPNMPNTLVQFRIDDTLRQQANDLCTKLGFDLPTYLRMSLTRLVQEQGVPFAIKLNSAPTANDAIAAMQKLSAISRANGNSEMTLDEINAEISAARNGRS